VILATYGDGVYKLLYLGHMLSFVVAFAPSVINPILIARLKAADDPAVLGRVSRVLHLNDRQIHLPALVALGGFGLAMVFASDPFFAFDQAWVSLAFLVWLAIGGIVTGVLLPNERKLSEGDLSAERKVERAGQLVTVLTLVMLYLMIWKPGL
jgi:hypothetical protein